MKKILARGTSFLLTLCLLLSGIACSAKTNEVSSFSDISSMEWYYNYVCYSIAQSFYQGTTNTLFEAERNLRRSEAITVLGRVHEKITGQRIPQETCSNYPDVSSRSFYNKYLNWAQNNGLTEFLNGELFYPNNAVTNEEMAVLLYRYISFLDIERKYEPIPVVYVDGKQVSSWAQEAIQGLSGYQIFRTDIPFDPQSVVTRGEAAALFVRMYQKLTYPMDRETPRLKYGHFDVLDMVEEWPLEEGETRIIRDISEFQSLVGNLPSNSKELSEGPPLFVNEDTFRDHYLIAVDVSVYNYEDGQISCEISNNSAEITFVTTPGAFSVEPIRGYLYILEVPQSVTDVHAETYWWVEDLKWTGS